MTSFFLTKRILFHLTLQTDGQTDGRQPRQ